MAFRVFDITATKGQTDTLRAIAEKYGASFTHMAVEDEEEVETSRILAGPTDRQKLLDAIQAALGTDVNGRVVILPVEAVVPQAETEEEAGKPAVETLRRALQRHGQGRGRGARLHPARHAVNDGGGDRAAAG